MKFLIDFVMGFLRGGLFVMLVVFVLFTIANVAVGDDTIATREATLGEQDRSLNYKYTTQDGVEHEHTIILEAPTTDDTVDKAIACANTNALLKASKDYAERRIKAEPKYAYLYDDVLELIEEKWCHDND